ncbi:MAG TPA: AarF/UbiB family protein [Acidimicrobiales bacterium]|nr:AarF/UbiB family protein [Acidimicrobiales bacterium]
MNSSGLIGREDNANWHLILVVRRLVEVAATLLWEFLAYCLSKAKAWRLGNTCAGGVHLRTALERLGPTFIKLGQILANQVEMVPASVQSDLSSLLDHAAPVPGQAIAAEIVEAYGRPTSEVFDSFNLEPIASASISQVHEATLAGERVAVKVRRPGVVVQVGIDLLILNFVARVVHRVSKRARGHNVMGLAGQLAGMVRAELDFEAEAANAERARAALAGQTRAVVPHVFHGFTRPNVLVMEYIEGISLSDRAALDACAHDGREVATTVMSSALCMMNGDRFHCDLHPGNIVYLPDGRIAILDYGACGTSTPETRKALSVLLFGLATADSRQLSEGALAFMVTTRPYDQACFSERLRQILLPVASSPLASITVARVLLDLLRVMHTYGLRLQADVALLVKAMVTAEATARDLHPEASFSEALLAFVAAQAMPTPSLALADAKALDDSAGSVPLQSRCAHEPTALEPTSVSPIDLDLRTAPSGSLTTPVDEPQPLFLTNV